MQEHLFYLDIARHHSRQAKAESNRRPKPICALNQRSAELKDNIFDREMISRQPGQFSKCILPFNCVDRWFRVLKQDCTIITQGVAIGLGYARLSALT